MGRSRRVWLWGLPLLMVSACALALWADREMGAGSLMALSRDVGQARERVAEAQAEKESIVREIRLLRDDVYTIESYARRELGMVRPGERVLRWPVKDR